MSAVNIFMNSCTTEVPGVSQKSQMEFQATVMYNLGNKHS